MNFHINLLLSTFVFCLTRSVRLDPLENNDKLQFIESQYLAEWQWESWPMKQNATEKDGASPGPRINAALWKDNNGLYWYLFGGQRIDPESEKVYSDIWKYSVATRVWERVFPFLTPQESKGKYAAKIGGMVTLRVNFFDENNSKKPPKHDSNNIILCGRSAKRNAIKTKKNVWPSLSRRKASDTKPNPDESKSLAVYGPRTSKSNTVWQIDLKDKLWTGYVCCCDTSNYDKLTSSPPSKNDKMLDGRPLNVTSTPDTSPTRERNQTSINVQIDKAEDEMDREQEHMGIDSGKIRKKKINQAKKKADDDKRKGKKEGPTSVNGTNFVPDKIQSESNTSKKINTSETLKNFSTETVLISKNQSDITTIFKSNRGKTTRDLKSVGRENATVLPFEKDLTPDDWDAHGNITEPGKSSSKSVSKYCPDFTEDEEPISWCDGSNDALITADLSSSEIVLWTFNLKTSHWSQKAVEIAEGTQWPACSNTSSIRYAGAGEEVYILCSTYPEYDTFYSDNSTLNATEPTRAEVEQKTKSVFRISSKRLLLESLGQIRMDRFSKQSDSRELWANESGTVIQVVRLSSNETLLLFAYRDVVDLWMLIRNDSTARYSFESVENIWRGSALKWFQKYYAVNYNFQFVSESNAAETSLMMNPRIIQSDEYWPRERGRFIIRILRNENVKNRSFHNQTRDQNLTYDLLQSDINSPIVDGTLAHSYNLKVLIFFGISLAIFTVFGVVVFLKKCVTCPSRILIQSECQKSPPIIRYSVMHDDILYPVA